VNVVYVLLIVSMFMNYRTGTASVATWRGSWNKQRESRLLQQA